MRDVQTEQTNEADREGRAHLLHQNAAMGCYYNENEAQNLAQ